MKKLSGCSSYRAGMLIFGSILGADAAHATLSWEEEIQDIPPATVALKQTETRFKFKNAGANTIKIKSVKTSCGCVLSALKKDVYAPGESGEVVATFVFGDRVGEQEKTIVVQTDDPEQPMKVLTMRVVIPQPLELTPALVLWRIGEIPEGKWMDLKVNVRASNGEDPVATPSSEDVEVHVEKGAEAGRYRVLVTPKSTAAPKTAFIRIVTGGDDPKSIVAHVRVK